MKRKKGVKIAPSIWGLSIWASGVAILEMGNAKGGKMLADIGEELEMVYTCSV